MEDDDHIDVEDPEHQKSPEPHPRAGLITPRTNHHLERRITSGASVATIAAESVANATGYVVYHLLLRVFCTRYDFPYPVFLTVVDQTFVVFLAVILVALFWSPSNNPNGVTAVEDDEGGKDEQSGRDAENHSTEDEHDAQDLHPSAAGEQDRSKTKRASGAARDEQHKDEEELDYDFYKEILPLGFLNIGSGATHNGALKFLVPSLHSMIQMTEVIPQLLLAEFYQGKVLAKTAPIAALSLTVGGCLFGYGAEEMSFTAVGLALSVFAVIFAVSVRLFTEEAMVRKEEQADLKTTFLLVRLLSPLNVIGLLVLSLLFEGTAPFEEFGTKVLRGGGHRNEGVGGGDNSAAGTTSTSTSGEVALLQQTQSGSAIMQIQFTSASDEPLQDIIGEKFAQLPVFTAFLIKIVTTTMWFLTDTMLIHHAGSFFASVQATANKVLLIGTSLYLLEKQLRVVQMFGLGFSLSGAALYLFGRWDNSDGVHVDVKVAGVLGDNDNKDEDSVEDRVEKPYYGSTGAAS
ncbi:unnamed protein product [Amoebophrya sp. A120]|nr:unnamed protein product [Amoebophrya sp. A120]|eukprot:GSA120T00006953001.1